MLGLGLCLDVWRLPGRWSVWSSYEPGNFSQPVALPWIPLAPVPRVLRGPVHRGHCGGSARLRMLCRHDILHGPVAREHVQGLHLHAPELGVGGQRLSEPVRRVRHYDDCRLCSR